MHWKQTIAFLILSCGLVAGQQTAPAVAQTNVQTKAASISGTVTRSDTHLPLKNVQVNIAGRGEGSSDAADAGDEIESAQGYQSSTNTDEKGPFEFADVAPGTYYLRAAHTGMVPR
jgi:hypothetical protein